MLAHPRTPSTLLLSLLVSVAAAVVAGYAGGHPGSADNDIDLEGDFYLASIDGKPLPYPLPSEGECRREVVAGGLRFEAGASFRLHTVQDVRCPGESATVGRTTSGRFVRAGSSPRLEPESGEARTGSLSDTHETFGSERFVRVGSGPGPRDLAGIETKGMERYLATTLADAFPDAYRCDADGALDAAAPVAPVAPADTAGLGARIDRHIPDCRLSTEGEIACRFPLLDGSTPAMYEGDHGGSGRAWRVLEGDLTGDGMRDRAAVLTSRNDPARDLLVALVL